MKPRSLNKSNAQCNKKVIT